MPNFTDAIADVARTATCGILAANENLNGWWARNTDLPFTDSLAAGAEALRRSLCDNPAPVESLPDPVGDIGQCTDTVYRITTNLTVLRSDGSTRVDRTETFLAYGDLRSVKVTSVPGNRQIGFEWLRNDGSTGQTTAIVREFEGETGSATILDNEVVSGPNDCGQTAPDLPADRWFPVPVPVSVTYVDNSNTQITELGDFNLTVPVFLPGSVTIPFSIDFPDFTFTGDLFPDGTIEINIDPGRQPDDTTTDEPVPELPPGQEPEDPETERRIVGAHVFTTLPPNTTTTRIFQEDGPDIFAPRGGSVRFLISGGGGTSWTRDIDIKGDRQYIPCPVPQGAIAVLGNELPGGTVSLIPVYASIDGYLIPD